MGESDPATAPAFDAIENLLEAGTLGEALQLARQVLLKRLPPPLRLTLKRRVDIVRYVSH